MELVYDLVLLLYLKLLKDVDIYVALKQQAAMLVNQEFRQIKLLNLLLLLIIDCLLILLVRVFFQLAWQRFVGLRAPLNLIDDGFFDYVVQELLCGLGIVYFLLVLLPFLHRYAVPRGLS